MEMATYDNVNQRRDKNWLKNALKYRLARVLPQKRNKNIWVFSAWEGQKYSDNAKYLFEYVLNNHPEIQCIWQTQNESVYNDLYNMGIPVQMIGSIEAERTQRNAGVAVYTNGLDDFGVFPSIYGAKIVALWHGVSFKKGYRLLVPDAKTVRAALGNLKWDFFNWVKRDITIVTSEYTKEQYRRAFRIKKPNNIFICGQARNDVFAQVIAVDHVIDNKAILDTIGGRRIILFMPTFRIDNTLLIKNIEAMVQNKRLREVLKSINSVMVCKLHYLCRGNFSSDDSFIFLNDADVKDVQCLMGCADAMVTDYSSAAVDFALLRRPILYYYPDHKEYDVSLTMMPETKGACSVNCADNLEEYVEQIKHIFDKDGSAYKQCDTLNSYFDDSSTQIGEYSEKAFRTIRNAVGI